MKIVLIVLAVVSLLVLGFLGVVAMQPSEFRVERSITVAAPPSAIFPYLNSQEKGADWAPWKDQDPGMKQSFEGAPEGVGAAVVWDGNDQVGAGRSTIVESRPDEYVKVKLEFTRPFEGVSFADFRLKPEGSGTVVTWSMYGPNNFIGKAMGLFMDCDQMVGGEFSRGLEKLKKLAENQP